MQVEMLVSSASAKGVRIAGKVYTVPNDEGIALVKAGAAKKVEVKKSTPNFEPKKTVEVDEDDEGSDDDSEGEKDPKKEKDSK